MSFSTIYNDIKSKIQSLRTDIATNTGTAVSDSFITPSAYIIDKNRVELGYGEALQTLYTIELLLANDDAIAEIASVELKSVEDVESDISSYIDKFADNFGITRFGATHATGNVSFGRTELLSANITIPASTVVKTLGGQEYTVDDDVVMVAPGNAYYDVDYRRYLISATVTANEEGTAGNTVSGTISQIVNPISGITYVTNKESITGGQDAESDTDLINRLKTILSGNTFGTKDGYKNLVLNNFRDVKDVYVSAPGDDLMFRDNGSGGMVDIWVLYENASESVTETFSGFDIRVEGPGYNGHTLTKSPVDELQSITADATGTLEKDVSEISGSYHERSFVYYTTAPATTFYDITYYYFPIISEIQTLLKTSQYAILGNTLLNGERNVVEDIALVRLAKKKLINISCTVNILPGFDEDIVLAALRTNINNYIADLKLGVKLSQSDLVNVIENTEGIDSVDLPFEIFNFTDVTGEEDELIVENNEYIRIDTLNIQI